MKTLCNVILFLFVLIVSVGNVQAKDLPLSTIPIIDVHSQVDYNTDIEKVIPLMDKAGVAKTILSTRFQRSSQDIIDFAEKYPDRIIPSFKTKTKAFMKGKSVYKKIIKREDENHTFGAMAEVILYHAQKGKKAGQAIVYPDSQQALDLLEIAKSHKWPFIFHIEFASAGKHKKQFMKKMEQVVSQNPTHSFGVIHMGQLDTKQVSRLIKKHTNIFFIMSHSNPVSLKNTKQPWTNMFKGYLLKPEWKKLIIQYPDQFVIAFDNVFPEHWGAPYLDAVKYWRSALSDLPEEAAHSIAHKNAERLWNISSIK